MAFGIGIVRRGMTSRDGERGHSEQGVLRQPPPGPRRRQTRVAVYRRQYSVLHLELDRSQLALLKALTDGVPLCEALAVTISASPSPRRQAKVFSWFRTWISEGLFSAVEVDAVR